MGGISFSLRTLLSAACSSHLLSVQSTFRYCWVRFWRLERLLCDYRRTNLWPVFVLPPNSAPLCCSKTIYWCKILTPQVGDIADVGHLHCHSCSVSSLLQCLTCLTQKVKRHAPIPIQEKEVVLRRYRRLVSLELVGILFFRPLTLYWWIQS